MLSFGYSNRVWTCPFFHWDERRKVHCEGGCVALKDARSFDRYARSFCASVNGWERCTVAKALVEQYERRERDEQGA